MHKIQQCITNCMYGMGKGQCTAWCMNLLALTAHQFTTLAILQSWFSVGG
jgi:hypothetical protein